MLRLWQAAAAAPAGAAAGADEEAGEAAAAPGPAATLSEYSRQVRLANWRVGFGPAPCVFQKFLALGGGFSEHYWMQAHAPRLHLGWADGWPHASRQLPTCDVALAGTYKS